MPLAAAFAFLGNVASVGTAGYEAHKAIRRSEMERQTIYVGLGALTILGLAYIETRKKAAATVATNAAVIATATVPTLITVTPVLAGQ